MKKFSTATLGASRAFVFAFVLALTVGCQSINHLRDAQDAFNQAATEDLRTTFDSTLRTNDVFATDAVEKWTSARNLYGSALVSLNHITGKDERVLRDEKLWGSKLALEALCHWKLGAYDKAVATAREAQSTDQLFPRDRVLMAALPGLIMVDHAYDLVVAPGTADPTNLVKKVASLTIDQNGAIDVIDAARSGEVVDPNLHVFLLQAQLAAYRNYRKAYETIVRTGVPQDAKPHMTAQKQLDELAKLVSGDSGKKLVEFWVERDHLRAPPPPQ